MTPENLPGLRITADRLSPIWAPVIQGPPQPGTVSEPQTSRLTVELDLEIAA
jgi:hypothetical protein